MKRLNYKRKSNPVLIILFILLAVILVMQFTVFKGNKFNLAPDKTDQRQSQNNQNQAIQMEENTVTVDFGDGRKIEKNVKAETPFRALQMVSDSEGFAVLTKEYKYGLIVEEINNVKNNSGKYWLYSVNNQPGKIAADRYQLNAGDVVKWEYTSAK
ncbi:hypothetical protein A2W14_05645 [Candidatus Gottesmanbacteria bacterium RBG_16_37_8]|uniref:Transcobalamin-like C-terminal domain-containing protein n=1 Tax=Candidatus Gottesmanbacteria bacterium RBG_16_37_8 TaxID=1798371 RepID=A0A1F5YUZ2_9BACT|nr:MAG: hypothetical protein A2W14_05645 [Candidatus Gottesmanbacteria bacterium RBG_16_37_8]